MMLISFDKIVTALCFDHLTPIYVARRNILMSEITEILNLLSRLARLWAHHLVGNPFLHLSCTHQ